MKKIGIAALLLCSMFSCKKNVPGYTDAAYSFDAVSNSATINVSDTALFTLAGNPDVISFYSGEVGSNYDNRNRTVLTGGTLQVKFETRVLNKPADTLEVLISNDFSGVYDSANVANASWKRITDRFNFPLPATTLGTFILSGSPGAYFTDITNNVVAGQPFYFAYRYDISKNSNIEWTVTKLGMYNLFNNGTPTATVIDSSNNNSGSFAAVKMGETNNRWTRTSTQYKFLNSNSSKIGASHWYISRPLNPNAVQPDLPVVIKSIAQSPFANFKYRYTKSGTYKAVFVASYNRLNFEKSFVKEFTIVVQ